MGRETVAVCHWNGEVAEVKLHLNNQFLKLRGDLHVDIPRAATFALDYPEKHIWMVHQEGKDAAVGDTAVRSYMRDLGFIDSKTSAVSDQLTTTRYRLRKA
jgi:hypothetical protein